MSTMHRLVARLATVAFFLGLPLSAQSLPELFQKAKAQVKSQSWREALTTLEQLDAESARPGNETARRQLVAPIAFYRGVCEANLDQAEKAEADFARFRQAQPDASIDEAVYSKKAVAAFAAAGANKGGASQPPGSLSLSLARRFEEFKTPPDAEDRPDERWADGPVKWLMTAEETAAWGALRSGAERAEFVEKFWQARNPRPGSEDNPVRLEVDRRIAFADAYLKVDEKIRGSLTDPGMVFVLLGPPARTTRRPLVADEDQSISEGMELPEQSWMGARNSIHIFGPHLTDATDNFRDVWHYRREALPKGVSVYELYIAFVTKRGYGRSVLQRDAATLSALNAARSTRPHP
jgi:GWxTD domain-containing protein